MKLQLRETVGTEHPDLVLRALEVCLQEISVEVVRSGNQLTASGIGPSHRIKNPKDQAVLKVIVEKDATVVEVSVAFQASALLGDQPQDSAVQSKFEVVFACMKAHLSNSDWTPAAARRLVEAAPEPLIQTGSLASHESLAEPTRHATPIVITSPAMASEPAGIPQGESEPITIAAGMPQAAPLMFRSLRENEPEEPRYKWVIAACVLACLAIASLFLLPAVQRRHLLYLAGRSASAPAASQVQTEVAPSPSAEPTPNGVGSPSASSPKQASIIPPSQTGTGSPEGAPSPMAGPLSLRTRVEDWGDALRSRDAAAQASFYSSRVQPYFGNPDADHDFVLHDKEISIQRRQRLWTVRLEKIQIEEETPSVAIVHLVKHFIYQTNGSSVSEQLVPSDLRFERVDGQWYVAAERDLPGTAPLP